VPFFTNVSKDFSVTNSNPRPPARKAGAVTRRHLTRVDDSTSARPHSNPTDTSREVRSHRARTSLSALAPPSGKVLQMDRFVKWSVRDSNPRLSGLQSHRGNRRHPTRPDQTRMVEPSSLFLANVTRHRSTTLRSHRARTAAAWLGNASEVVKAPSLEDACATRWLRERRDSNPRPPA